MHHEGCRWRRLFRGCDQAFIFHVRLAFSGANRSYAHEFSPASLNGSYAAGIEGRTRDADLRSRIYEAFTLSTFAVKGTFSAAVSKGTVSSTPNSAAIFFNRSAASPLISPPELKMLRMAAKPFRRSATSAGSNFGIAARAASG